MLLLVGTATAADLGTPQLSTDPPDRKLFDPDHFLSAGRATLGSSQSFSLTPEVGLGYFSWGRELQGGVAESLHQVHARAGGRVDLLDVFYLSGAAKLPVYTYDVQDRRLATLSTSQQPQAREQYDLFQSPRSKMSWSSEVGVRLGPQLDLNLFYDQNQLFTLPAGSGTLHQQEERFGTRFIFRFK
ncbi:MAG TPA: hypothetical protein VIU41_08360 [Geobacteraceae bacterium]